MAAGGAKNSVLKLMAACLLAEGVHTLENVPNITDVDIMAEVLRALGCEVERGATDRLVITTPATNDLIPVAPYELVEKMRASIVVLGPHVCTRRHERRHRRCCRSPRRPRRR